MTEAPKARPAPEKQKTCFVVMPIADMDGYEPGHFNRVYEDLIKPACEKSGFEPIRADDVKNATFIHATILHHLIEADMVICDLSGKNPNVMFELGIRQAHDKPVVLIREEGTDRIFDIDPIKYINYSRSLRYDSVIKSQEEISISLNETFSKKDSPDSVNSIVRLLSITKAKELKPSENETRDILYIMMSEINKMKEIMSTNSRFSDKNKFEKTIEKDTGSLFLFNKLYKIRKDIIYTINSEIPAKDKKLKISMLLSLANDICRISPNLTEKEILILEEIEGIVSNFKAL